LFAGCSKRERVLADLADYEILETEVTNAQYPACEAAGRCSARMENCRVAADVTKQGVCDLVGNVEEWVTVGGHVGERGGSYAWAGPTPLVSRYAANGEYPELELGFRCVRPTASP
jgi:formylglycine-generating enzyme required for sulfatase activity